MPLSAHSIFFFAPGNVTRHLMGPHLWFTFVLLGLCAAEPPRLRLGVPQYGWVDAQQHRVAHFSLTGVPRDCDLVFSLTLFSGRAKLSATDPTSWPMKVQGATNGLILIPKESRAKYVYLLSVEGVVASTYDLLAFCARDRAHPIMPRDGVALHLLCDGSAELLLRTPANFGVSLTSLTPRLPDDKNTLKLSFSALTPGLQWEENRWHAAHRQLQSVHVTHNASAVSVWGLTVQCAEPMDLVVYMVIDGTRVQLAPGYPFNGQLFNATTQYFAALDTESGFESLVAGFQWHEHQREYQPDRGGYPTGDYGYSGEQDRGARGEQREEEDQVQEGFDENDQYRRGDRGYGEQDEQEHERYSHGRRGRRRGDQVEQGLEENEEYRKRYRGQEGGEQQEEGRKYGYGEQNEEEQHKNGGSRSEQEYGEQNEEEEYGRRHRREYDYREQNENNQYRHERHGEQNEEDQYRNGEQNEEDRYKRGGRRGEQGYGEQNEEEEYGRQHRREYDYGEQNENNQYRHERHGEQNEEDQYRNGEQNEEDRYKRGGRRGEQGYGEQNEEEEYGRQHRREYDYGEQNENNQYRHERHGEENEEDQYGQYGEQNEEDRYKHGGCRTHERCGKHGQDENDIGEYYRHKYTGYQQNGVLQRFAAQTEEDRDRNNSDRRDQQDYRRGSTSGWRADHGRYYERKGQHQAEERIQRVWHVNKDHSGSQAGLYEPHGERFAGDQEDFVRRRTSLGRELLFKPFALQRKEDGRAQQGLDENAEYREGFRGQEGGEQQRQREQDQQNGFRTEQDRYRQENEGYRRRHSGRREQGEQEEQRRSQGQEGGVQERERQEQSRYANEQDQYRNRYRNEQNEYQNEQDQYGDENEAYRRRYYDQERGEQDQQNRYDNEQDRYRNENEDSRRGSQGQVGGEQGEQLAQEQQGQYGDAGEEYRKRHRDQERRRYGRHQDHQRRHREYGEHEEQEEQEGGRRWGSADGGGNDAQERRQEAEEREEGRRKWHWEKEERIKTEEEQQRERRKREEERREEERREEERERRKEKQERRQERREEEEERREEAQERRERQRASRYHGERPQPRPMLDAGPMLYSEATFAGTCAVRTSMGCGNLGTCPATDGPGDGYAHSTYGELAVSRARQPLFSAVRCGGKACAYTLSLAPLQPVVSLKPGQEYTSHIPQYDPQNSGTVHLFRFVHTSDAPLTVTLKAPTGTVATFYSPVLTDVCSFPVQAPTQKGLAGALAFNKPARIGTYYFVVKANTAHARYTFHVDAGSVKKVALTPRM